MMLAGQPRDSVGWGKVCSEAVRAIDKDARQYCGTVHGHYSHSRGGLLWWIFFWRRSEGKQTLCVYLCA